MAHFRRTNSCTNFAFPHACYIYHPSHPPWCDYPISPYFDFDSPPLPLCPPVISCPVRRLSWKTPSGVFALRIRHEMSHPPKAARKFIVLVLLHGFMSEVKWKDAERYWAEWQQSRMPFTSEFRATVILIYWRCFKIHSVPCCWLTVRIVVVVCICCTTCALLFLLSMPDCWLEVSIRKVLRPATSAQVFLGFRVYKQMLRWFPTFQVPTTCFSCSPPDLNLLVTNFIFSIHVK